MNREFLKKRNINDIWNDYISKQKEQQYLKFGVTEIDNALNGGLPVGKIVELYGPSGSGKTQCALSLVSQILIENLIHSKDSVVLYLYTNGNFPIHRIIEIIETKYYDNIKSIEEKEGFKLTDLLNNLYIYKVTDHDELLHILTSKIKAMLKFDVKLLIVDSIASLFRMISEEESTDYNFKAIVRVGAIMKRLAHEYDLLVLVINQATTPLNQKKIPFLNPRYAVKPSLGEVWQRCINSRILISRRRDERFMKEIRHFQVIFSSSSPTSYPIPFITSKRGIEYNMLLYE